MCKRYFESIDTDITTFAQSSDDDKNYINTKNEASDIDYDSNSDDKLLDPHLSDDNDLYMNERCNHTNNKDNNILDDDNIEKCLTTNFDADIPLDYNDDVGNNRRNKNYKEFLSDIFNQVTTTNAGELAYIVDEGTQYGGNFENIQISGNVFINQLDTLFKLKKQQTRRRSLHDIFLQRICATIHGLSIPLMNPEETLFP